MNDTHGVAGKGWYGFDLDGTLAVYDKWEGIDHIGEPIKPMVDLIKKLHDEGKVVKILTARVSPRKVPEVKDNPYRGIPSPDYAKVDNAGFGLAMSLGAMYARDTWGAREFIIDWCLKYLSFIPEITHEKNHLMLYLYDDRVKQVVPNKGLLIEDIARIQSDEIRKCERIFNDYDRANISLQRKLNCKFNGFAAGMMLGTFITVVTAVVIFIAISAFSHSANLTDAEKNLHNAIHCYLDAKAK